MRAQIQDCNFLTRKRIRFRFKRFIQQFSQCRTTVRDLKLKYLISMESLEKSFYTETFQVKEPSGVQRIILVAADTGIQWCRELSKDSEQVGTMSTTVLVYILEDKETDVSLEHLLIVLEVTNKCLDSEKTSEKTDLNYQPPPPPTPTHTLSPNLMTQKDVL